MGLPELKLADSRCGPVLRGKGYKIRYATVMPSLTAGSKVGFHNSSLPNVIRALEERVFRVKKMDGTGFEPPPLPDKGAFRGSEMIQFRKLYVAVVGQLAPHSIEQVLACYPGRRRAPYTRASKTLHLPITRKDAQVQAFVKVEKLDLGLKEDPCPRLIQPRSKRYNLKLGQYLRLHEKRLTKAIDTVFGEITVLSGYDSFSQGEIIHRKWKKYSNPRGIGLDASRFDQHTSIPALKFEHSCWNHIFNDSELKRLLEMQLYNKGIAYSDCGTVVRYKTNGCRMSGDINTSLGNKLIMCAMVWAYLRRFEIKASLVNNGDDCVLICEAEEVDKIQSTLTNHFFTMGYNMVMEQPVSFIEGIEFCRSRPVAVGNSYHMVRGVSSLSRDCVTLLNIQSNPMEMKRMLTAVGYCGMVINTGIPIHSVLHGHMYELGGLRVTQSMLETYTEDQVRFRAGNLKLNTITIDDKTRLSYFRAFGIPPHRQKLIESYYLNTTVAAETFMVKDLSNLFSPLHPNLFRSIF
jgi:hypothetical protein